MKERAAADTRRFARARGPHLLDIVNREGSNTGGSGSGGGSGAARLSTYACARASSVKSVLNWANVSTRTLLEVFGEASWFLTGRTFLREPSWEYLSNCDEAIFGVRKASLNMFWVHSPYSTNIASDWLRAELSCG